MFEQLNSSKEDEQFLSEVCKSKAKFIQRYKQLYFGKSKSKDLYLLVLTKLHTAISKGNIDDFKIYESLIEFISGEERLETLKFYYDDVGNPIKNSSLIILACKFGNIEILDHIFNSSQILFQLPNNVDKNPVKPDNEDETCHNAFYYAVRSSNTKLLETLIDKWSGNHFVKHPKTLEDLLSKTYGELVFKNVSLSDEMKIFVENKLMNLRFFSNRSGPVQKVKNKPNTIRERINLVLESINLLYTDYSSEKEVDSKFFFVARFITQNIHVLKQQLQFTCDELPWEEVEFCLASFIFSHTEQQEINALCLAVLNKSKILGFLKNFAKKLDNIDIVNGSKLAELSNLQGQFLAKIIKKDPLFAGLFRDCVQIRDIYSLQLMSSYINRALSVNLKSKTGQLSIIRALQVIGENLENTWKSPKLSDTTRKLVLLSVSKNLLNMITELHNSLSHHDSIPGKTEIERNMNNRFFFTGIIDDISKVGVAIDEILHERKLKIILTLLEKIVSTKKCAEVKEFSEVLYNILKYSMISNDNFMLKEQNNIEKLIEQLKSRMNRTTDFEQNQFNEIQKIIHSKQHYPIRFEVDHVQESINFLFAMKKLRNCDKKDINVFIADIKANILPRVGSCDLKMIANIVLKIYESIKSRLEDQNVQDVVRKIFFIAKLETSKIEQIEELNSKITFSKDEKHVQDYSLKTKESFSILDQKLSLLSNILKEHKFYDQLVEKFPSYKKDIKLQSTLEMLVLDTISILGRLQSSSPRNVFFLDEYAPSLIGKSLRNYLAHGDVVMDALLTSNPLMAVLLNAIKLTEGDLMKNVSKIGKLLPDDPFKLREKYIKDLAVVTNQDKMFAAILEGKADNLKDSLKEGADVYARCFNLQTALHFAAMGPDLEIFSFIYSHNLSLNVKDKNGQSPLHIAAACGRTNIVEFIVKERRVCVNDADNDGNTPLHVAAQNGHKSVVELLLRNIPDPNVKNTEGFTSLHCAVKYNRTNVLKMLLGEKMNVNVHIVQGNLTLLHIASKHGSLGSLKFLLTKNANVNAVCNRGWTALHYSGKNGNTETVTALIEKGANINARSICGDTSLHLAAEYGNVGIVKVLLDKGALIDVKSYENNITPLHLAAKNGYSDIVQLLLDKGANPNWKDKQDFTPLHASALGDCQTNVIEALIQSKSDVNAINTEGNTPLHLAVESSKEKAIKTFLKYRAHIHVKNKHRYTPIELAVLKGNLQILKLLLQHENAHLTIKGEKNCDSTLLHLATQLSNIDVVSYLIVKGANVNCKSKPDNETPLHLVARNGNIEIARMLIKSGANISTRNGKGLEPIHIASECGNKEIVRTLMEEKINIDTKNQDNYTPLHCAAQVGHLDIIQILIDGGANIDAKATDGSTPLCVAILTGNKKIVKYLMKKGAKTDIVCDDKMTPLHIAANEGHATIVGLLLNNKCNVNGRSAQDSTAIELAVLHNHIETVKTLLQDERVNINATDCNKYTILHTAAQLGHLDIVNYLIRKGADLNIQTLYGHTPLNLATLKGHTEVVEAFKVENFKTNIESKVDVKAKDLESCSIFCHQNDYDTCCPDVLSNYDLKTEITAEDFEEKDDSSVESDINETAEKNSDEDNSNDETIEVVEDVNANVESKIVETVSGLKSCVINNYQLNTDDSELNVTSSEVDLKSNYDLKTRIAVEDFEEKDDSSVKNDNNETAEKNNHEEKSNDETIEVVEDASTDVESKIVETADELESYVINNHPLDTDDGELNVTSSEVDLKSNYDLKTRIAVEDFEEKDDSSVENDNNETAEKNNHEEKSNDETIEVVEDASTDVESKIVETADELESYVINNHPLNTDDGETNVTSSEVDLKILNVGEALKVKDDLGVESNVGETSEKEESFVNQQLCDLNVESNVGETSEKKESFVSQQLCDPKGLQVDVTSSHPGLYSKESLPGVLKLPENDSSRQPETPDVLIQISKIEMVKGNYLKAKELLEYALKILESNQGSERVTLVETLINLGEIYAREGSPHKQIKVLEHVMRIQEEDYGTKSSKLIETLISLSVAYGNSGNQLKTIQLLEQALRIQEKYNDTDHLKMAKILINLSNVYGALGNPLKQKELLEKTLIFQKKAPNPDYVSIAITHNTLGAIHLLSGDFLAAKYQLEQALEIKENYHGIDHPELIDILINLNSIYTCLGDHQQCKKVSSRALKIQKKLYGTEHFEVAETMMNLGQAYGSLGDLQKYKLLCEKAVSMTETQYGRDHLKVNKQLLNLGVAHSQLQNYQEAMKIFDRVLKIQEKHYGVNFFENAGVLNNMSLCCDALGLHEQNQKLLERALDINKKHFGPEHISVAHTLLKLSLAYKDLGNYQKEKEAIEQAVKIQEKNTGSESVEMARMLINLGVAYLNLDNPSHSLMLFNKVLSIFKNALGSQNPEFLSISASVEMLIQQCLMKIDSLKMMNSTPTDDTQILQYLLGGKNEVNYKDSDGRTPLHYAINMGKLSIVQILLEKGANVTQVTNKGNTPLHTATSKNYVEIVKVLLQRVNCDALKQYVNAKTTSSGTTSLHIAAKNGCLDVVKSLLRHGAIYNAVNNEGKTPLDLSKNQEITNLLNLIDELFKDVEKGNVYVTNKLKTLKPDEFSIITSACNDQGHGLLHYASIMNNKYKCVENELSELLNK